MNTIPKILWLHWLQGIDNAPPVVAACIKRWQEMNPDYEVRIVDENSIWDYLDKNKLPIEKLLGSSKQVYSDAIRLALLRQHGGVWADATTWCRKPLSDWLPQLEGSFFTFAAPGIDRMISTWFMAAHQDSYIIDKYRKEYIDLFDKIGPLKIFPHEMTYEILTRTRNTDVFFRPFLLSILKGYPYFLVHYLFAYLYKRDEKFKAEWDQTSKLSALPCNEPSKLGLLKPLSKADRALLKKNDAPLYKLNWRIEAFEKNSLIQQILDKKI